MKSKKERLHPITRGFLPALVLFIFLVSLSPVLAQRDDPENIPPPDSVIIAGTLGLLRPLKATMIALQYRHRSL